MKKSTKNFLNKRFAIGKYDRTVEVNSREYEQRQKCLTFSTTVVKQFVLVEEEP